MRIQCFSLLLHVVLDQGHQDTFTVRNDGLQEEDSHIFVPSDLI